MSDDMKKILDDAVSKEISRQDRAPSFDNVRRRAKRFRTRRLSIGGALLAALTVAAISLPSAIDFGSSDESRVARSDGDGLDVATTETVGIRGSRADAAASFAVRAVSEAGWLNPVGAYLDYQGIDPLSAGWRVKFERYDCPPASVSSGCKLLGSDQRTLALVVRDTAGAFVISDTTNLLGLSIRDHLLAYTEPSSTESSRLTYPTVTVERVEPGSDLAVAEGAGWAVQGAVLWEGPIPAPGVISECALEAFDAEGNLIYKDEMADEPAPESEDARSGSLQLTVIRPSSGVPTAVEINCTSSSDVQTEDWVPVGEPKMSIESADSVYVSSELVWSAEKAPNEWELCTAVVYDSHDSVVGSGSSEAYVAEDANPETRPLRGGFGTTVILEAQGEPAKVEVKC